MAVYKVIQDIEAEDKLLGPLTLRGFVYAAAAVLLGFINFKLLTSGTPIPLKLVFVALFSMPMVLFAVLASPLGREQPTEVWLLARIKFMIKPHERLWNQLGGTDLVTVTVPKKEELHLTKNFGQDEAVSRLQALAQTLDSRGWAVKNTTVNVAVAPHYERAAATPTDRLVETRVTAEPMPVLDVHESDDILDEQNSPTAQNFVDLMDQAEEIRRQELATKLEAARKKPVQEAPEIKVSDPETQKMLDDMHDRERFYAATGKTETRPSQTAKLELSQSGNDLSVAAIAKLANRSSDEAA